MDGGERCISLHRLTVGEEGDDVEAVDRKTRGRLAVDEDGTRCHVNLRAGQSGAGGGQNARECERKIRFRLHDRFSSLLRW